jgi:hemolysin III
MNQPSAIVVAAPRQLTYAEEFANFLTHGIGLVLSLAGVAVMAAVLTYADSWRVAGCSIYLASLVGVYLMSTLSHTFETPQLRSFLRALDQGTIYFLIVGTYTPFALAYLHTWTWMALLAICWGIALYNFASKVFFAHRVESVNMWPCIILGGIPLVSLPTLLSMVSVNALVWMLLGMACYCLGLVFWCNDRKVKHFHAVWHILVIAGSACHFVGIMLFVVLVR